MSEPQSPRPPEYRQICEDSASDVKHRIRPDDFNLDNPNTLSGTFGESQAEEVVKKLLAFFQSRGYWCRFTIDELMRFYKLKGWNPAPMLYGLAATGGWPSDIMLVGDRYGDYNVTDKFIERCGKNLGKTAA
jgi:hypothetical protein